MSVWKGNKTVSFYLERAIFITSYPFVKCKVHHNISVGQDRGDGFRVLPTKPFSPATINEINYNKVQSVLSYVSQRFILILHRAKLFQSLAVCHVVLWAPLLLL
jgi:hypothetical protein